MSELRAVRRERQRTKSQYGMKVTGVFVKTTLANLPGVIGFAAKRRDEADKKKRKR